MISNRIDAERPIGYLQQRNFELGIDQRALMLHGPIPGLLKNAEWDEEIAANSKEITALRERWPLA